MLLFKKSGFGTNGVATAFLIGALLASCSTSKAPNVANGCAYDAIISEQGIEYCLGFGKSWVLVDALDAKGEKSGVLSPGAYKLYARGRHHHRTGRCESRIILSEKTEYELNISNLNLHDPGAGDYHAHAGVRNSKTPTTYAKEHYYYIQDDFCGPGTTFPDDTPYAAIYRRE